MANIEYVRPGRYVGNWRAPTIAVFAFLATGCGQPAEQQSTADMPKATAREPAATNTASLTVYTVNYPLAYFAARIGGDRVRVEFPAPPDGDPANWAPGEADITAYATADLVLLNGAGYAGWINTAVLPADKLVDTSAAFADRLIDAGSAVTHSHGDGVEHSHGDEEGNQSSTAFTTWLDPQLAIAQAAAIRDSLILQQPESAADFRAGFDSLEADLTALDQDFEAVFEALGDTPVVFSHPVYQYLERRYGVNGISVHWEPGEAPGDDELTALGEKMIRHPARLMIWEGEPIAASAELIAAWDVDNVVLDPCGNRPDGGDYLQVMRQNVANLQAALSD
ncbi:MAG: zinc ABC transporter substrate-binding protein [Gammaproteobacteria bacterium]|nr:zinc ABC transporter substrate-binding protein [Gammaproteobacteria bacterium]